MPTYNPSPFAAPPVKLIPGQPAYLYGSWQGNVSPTKMRITGDQATSATVAIYNVLITEGNIPVVGSLMTVYGTANSSGQFNMTNVAVSAVSITATTGVGTITVTGSGLTTVAQTADGGFGIIPQPEVGDTVANGQSIAVGLPYAIPQDAGQGAEALQCEVSFPTLPTACVVALQVAATNTPATQWQTAIANVVTVTTSVATYGTTQWTGKANFARYAITGTSGSGTIVAKLVS
jgi:hypothetical protein